MYFLILCKFLRTKLQRLNDSSVNIMRGNEFLKIETTILSFNRLYREIEEYNRTYWSKFLLNVWLTFGTLIVCLLHMTTIPSLPIIIIIILTYVSIILWIIFLFTIFITTSVHSEANKANKFSNTSFILYSGRRNTGSRKLKKLFKVKYY